MSGLLLGVDIGTASAKGVLARPDGEVVATAERLHGLPLPNALRGLPGDLPGYPATREHIHKLAKMQQGGADIAT